MLNSEEEDCVPVWPNEEFALQWATGEWSECRGGIYFIEQMAQPLDNGS